MRDLKKMNASLDVMPCISGDIWSEGDLALLAILQHHISPRFEMVEKVLAVIPFSDSSHSGEARGYVHDRVFTVYALEMYSTVSLAQ